MKIVHIINGLGNGGAENMLYKILKYSNKDVYEHSVISLTNYGTLGDLITKCGVRVDNFNLKGKNLINVLLKVKKKCEDADVISTWLYHSDFIGFIISKVFMKKKIIWNIRHSNLDTSANKRGTLKIIKLNSKLSNYVDMITYNSTESFVNHKKIGYKNKKSKIIPNGFEMDKLVFDANERLRLRKGLSVSNDGIVFITVGRWNIQKDYYTLLEAIYIVKRKGYQFKLVMVGENLDYKNKELENTINKYSLENTVILLGVRKDVSKLLSAADVYVSSSLGESFSNSIGEAMGAGLTCIVTDVGESRKIVGDTGIVVQPKKTSDMAEAITDVIMNYNHKRNYLARKRIKENYDITKVVNSYEKLYYLLIHGF